MLVRDMEMECLNSEYIDILRTGGALCPNLSPNSKPLAASSCCSSLPLGIFDLAPFPLPRTGAEGRPAIVLVQMAPVTLSSVCSAR